MDAELLPEEQTHATSKLTVVPVWMRQILIRLHDKPGFYNPIDILEMARRDPMAREFILDGGIDVAIQQILGWDYEHEVQGTEVETAGQALRRPP